MIILAKDKDYYDYLADGKGVVLDRRDAEKFSLQTMKRIVLHIGGWRYEGMFINGDIVYGMKAIKEQKVKNAAPITVPHVFDAPTNTNPTTHLYFNLRVEGGYYFYTKESSCILKEKQPSIYNDRYNCPILIWDNGFKKYPNLELLKFDKHVSAWEIYEILNNWYGTNIMANNDILRDSLV